MDDQVLYQGQHTQKAGPPRYEGIVVDTDRPGASLFIVSDESYEGQYVAMPSFNDRTVIASGRDWDDVWRRAGLMGYPSPVVQYIPKGETLDV